MPTMPTPLSTPRLAAALLTAAALALSACGDSGGSTGTSEPVAAVAPPAGKKWSEVVSATRDGMVMGNPEAPLKLIEFASPTCSHCAEFSRTGAAQLKSEFVDSGRVSLEIRPFMLNPMDLVIASIVTCSGPDRFFPLLENVYASQNDLFAGFQSASQEAAQSALQSQNFAAFGRVLGLEGFFAARGMTAADINTCLSNRESVVRWQESTERNQQQYEITGTPTFVLNDQVLTGVTTWDGVSERLRAAGAR